MSDPARGSGAAAADCTANRLVTLSGRDKARITRVLKELEAMELIPRTPHPGDRRSQILALNEQGRALMERTREVDTFVAIARGMLANLRDNTPEE